MYVCAPTLPGASAHFCFWWMAGTTVTSQPAPAIHSCPECHPMYVVKSFSALVAAFF